jgi:hypothetical protein
MAEEKEPFLARWSRLKGEARTAPDVTVVPEHRRTEAEAPPKLPPLEELGLESDYRGFFHPKVDENLRRAALKRLFSDPHFNIMDGLDVYIDDYSKPSPLPAEMLAGLRQAQQILARAKELERESHDAAAAAVASGEPPMLPSQTEAQPAPPATTEGEPGKAASSAAAPFGEHST